MSLILEGKALWSYDFEVLQRNASDDIAYQFSGIIPCHSHIGIITLNEKNICIVGDINLSFSLTEISQIYLGFDDVYSENLSKNLEFFWQPLRLELVDGKIIYLIIDYNFSSAKNKTWFNKLITLLSCGSNIKQ